MNPVSPHQGYSATNDPNGSAGVPESEIACATVGDGEIALVRITGRGTHHNAAGFKKFAELIQDTGGVHKFVLDLDPCETMDSTFLGVLASVALRQKASGAGSLIVLNANSQVQRILRTMGLIHVLDMREVAKGQCPDVARAEGALRPTDAPAMSRLEQICVTLQAHKDLAELDPDNRVRFENVITYLEHSLAREKAKASN